MGPQGGILAPILKNVLLPQPSQAGPMPRYQTEVAEPGIMFEIYLPKKLEYQSRLYETLRDGHTHEKVTDWLLTHQDHVRPLLPPVLRHAFPRRMETRHEVYFGFSMYEVDGVFFDQNGQPIEDRTQVLRLILYPDYNLILHGVKESVREDVMEHVRLFRKLPLSLSKDPVARYNRFYVYDRKEITPEMRKGIEKALEAMEIWIQDAYVFVFCYVIGNITELEAIDEKEIWVTSYRSAVVNRILPMNPTA